MAKKIKEQANCDYAAPGARICKYDNIENKPKGNAKMFTKYLDLDKQNLAWGNCQNYVVDNTKNPDTTNSYNNFDVQDYTTLGFTTAPDGLMTFNDRDLKNGYQFVLIQNASGLIKNELPNSYLLDVKLMNDKDALRSQVETNFNSYISTLNKDLKNEQNLVNINYNSPTEALNEMLSHSKLLDDELNNLFLSFTDMDNSDNIAQDIFYILEMNGCFKGWQWENDGYNYKNDFIDAIKTDIDKEKNLKNIYSSGDLESLLDYFKATNQGTLSKLDKLRRGVIVTIFNDEYNILSIITEDEFCEKIVECNFDLIKIREYIERELSE